MSETLLTTSLYSQDRNNSHTDKPIEPAEPTSKPIEPTQNKPSTPVVHRLSAYSFIDWESFKLRLDHRKLAREMARDEFESKIVEIPADQFIQEFVKSHDVDEIRAIDELASKAVVADVLNVEGGIEKRRYVPLIKLIEPAWRGTGLVPRNVSLWLNDAKNIKITADIAAYEGDANGRTPHDKSTDDVPYDPETYKAGMNYNDAELFLEDKSSPKNSALHSNPNKPYLGRASEANKLARGQIGEYAAEILRRQHRCHLFSIVTVHNTARFLRWDRSGVIASTPICFSEETGLKTFLTFLYRFSRMSRSERGHDTSVLEPSIADLQLLNAFKTTKLPTLVPNHQKFFGEAFDVKTREEEWPIRKVVLKPLDCRNTDSTSTSLPNSQDIRLLIRAPRVAARSLFGRGTKGFVALDLDEMRLKFLKDSWRYDDKAYHPELEVYRKLQASGVKYIAKAEGGGDVHHPGSDDPQVTVAHSYLSKDKFAHLKQSHYRLLTRQLGTPLEQYSSSMNICLYVYLALLGHRGAFRAGVLHRDLSPNNILIDEAPEQKGWLAFLHDWDLCKYREELNKGQAQKSRSGTWAFMSGVLLRYPNKQHDLGDDLESFIHILHWFCLRFHAHDRTSSEIARILSDVYFASERESGYDLGGMHKFDLMKKGGQSFTLNKAKVAKGLVEIVTQMSELCKDHYSTLDFNALEQARLRLLSEAKESPTPTKKPLPVQEGLRASIKAILDDDDEDEVDDLSPSPSKNPLIESSETMLISNPPSNSSPSSAYPLRSATKTSGQPDAIPLSPLISHAKMIDVFKKILKDDTMWPQTCDKEDDQFVQEVYRRIKMDSTRDPTESSVTGSKRSASQVNSDSDLPASKRSRIIPSDDIDVTSLEFMVGVVGNGRSIGKGKKSQSSTSGMASVPEEKDEDDVFS